MPHNIEPLHESRSKVLAFNPPLSGFVRPDPHSSYFR
jgi:hypothetical protein